MVGEHLSNGGSHLSPQHLERLKQVHVVSLRPAWPTEENLCPKVNKQSDNNHLFNTRYPCPAFLGTDPYVKVSLLCDGRRLKKKKTTIKKNTLNPVYNEAIIFDIPPENMDQVSLLISVMDYDR